MRESKIESYVCDTLEAWGFDSKKLAYVGSNGAPDRLFRRPSLAFVVEFKRPKKTPRVNQTRDLDLWRSSGVPAFAVNSMEEAELLLFWVKGKIDERKS